MGKILRRQRRESGSCSSGPRRRRKRGSNDYSGNVSPASSSSSESESSSSCSSSGSSSGSSSCRTSKKKPVTPEDVEAFNADILQEHADFEIPEQDLKLQKKIGSGSFGDIWKGNLWGQDVAVKSVKGIDSGKLDKSDLTDFKQEIRLLVDMRHPHIVAFLGVCVREKALCLITELCCNGSLDKYLDNLWKAGRKLSIRTVLNFSIDIARGLAWLHHRGVIHRDIKTANILLDRSLNIKIADFGLAHIKERLPHILGEYGDVGTPCYMAPEVLSKSHYNTSADVFSFGVVMCELLTGFYPFKVNGRLPTHRAFDHTNEFGDVIMTGERPDIPRHCPPELEQLIRECWEEEPKERPSIDDALKRLIEIRDARGDDIEELISELPPRHVRLWTNQSKAVARLSSKLKKTTVEISKHREQHAELRKQLDEYTKQVEVEFKQREELILQLEERVNALNRKRSSGLHESSSILVRENSKLTTLLARNRHLLKPTLLEEEEEKKSESESESSEESQASGDEVEHEEGEEEEEEDDSEQSSSSSGSEESGEEDSEAGSDAGESSSASGSEEEEDEEDDDVISSSESEKETTTRRPRVRARQKMAAPTRDSLRPKRRALRSLALKTDNERNTRSGRVSPPAVLKRTTRQSASASSSSSVDEDRDSGQARRLQRKRTADEEVSQQQPLQKRIRLARSASALLMR